MTAPAGIEAVERSARRPLAAWILVAAEATVGFSLAGILSDALGPWIPDPGVVLLLALAAGGDRRPLWTGALVVSLARAAVGVDPPAAILAGYLAVAAVHGAVCSVVDPDGPVVRAIAAFLFGSAIPAWLLGVHALRPGGPGGPGGGGLEPEAILAGAAAAGVATAVGALVLVPLVRALPGVVPGGWRRAARRRSRRSGWRFA